MFERGDRVFLRWHIGMLNDLHIYHSQEVKVGVDAKLRVTLGESRSSAKTRESKHN